MPYYFGADDTKLCWKCFGDVAYNEGEDRRIPECVKSGFSKDERAGPWCLCLLCGLCRLVYPSG